MNAPARFFPPARQPRVRRASPRAIAAAMKEARAAGLDVTGAEALPDGTIRVLLGNAKPATLFDELEKQGKL